MKRHLANVGKQSMMPIDGNTPYTPSEADQALFNDIGRLVRSRPELFIQAGRSLDEDFNSAGMIRREARQKLRDYRRFKGIKNAWPRTRAGCRKASLPLDSEPVQRDDGGLKHPLGEELHRHASPGRFADGERKPKDTYERFLAAVQVVVDGDELVMMKQTERHNTALRIVLLTWLMTDPDADQFEPVLTREFQCAGWVLKDEWYGDKAHQHAVWIPDEHQGKERQYIEHFYDRYWWRRHVFDDSRFEWPIWVRRAWDVVQNELIQESKRISGPIGGGMVTADDRETGVERSEEKVEHRDADGFVVDSADELAYVAVTDILTNHTPDAVAISYKQLKVILDANRGTVRQWRPRANRLCVHLNDWLEHVARLTAPSEGGDNDPSPAELAERAARVRASRVQHSGQ